MITGCIVLYKNNREVLGQAIESFLKSHLISQLYLVDNSPTNELENLVKDSRIIYIHNPSNPGFGASHNIALRKAIAHNSTYHVVLNPDVYYTDDVIENLCEYMNNNQKVGNVMPKVNYPDGNLQYLCKLLPTPYDWIGRRFNPFKKLVENRNKIFELKFADFSKKMFIPYLSGCFMFLRIDSIKKIGYFDEKIFMYGEDTDLNRRLISAGYDTIYNPDVTIYHHFEKGSHKSWRLTKIGIASAIYYFNKWGWFFDKERTSINKRALQSLYK